MFLLNVLNSVASYFNLTPLIMLNDYLDNNSFESPLISGAKYYGDFTDLEKLQFSWTSGGNLKNPNGGVVISDGGTGFGFPTFITGEQAVGIQSNSFIQQSISMSVGTYVFSTYFMSRFGTQNNPINIYVGGKLITTINQLVTGWTLFTYTFNILEAGNKIIRLEGTATTELTTGLDLVAIALKELTIIPLLNDKFISNTTTQKTALGYIVSASSTKPTDGSNSFGQTFQAFDGDSTTFWLPNTNNSTYVNNNYVGGGSPETFFKTIVSGVEIDGEWLQMKLANTITLKSFKLRSIFDAGYSPKLFTIAGSNDGNTWSLIKTISLSTSPASNLITYVTSSNVKTYLYYRIIFQQNFGQNTVFISQIDLTGTEKGKISTNFDNTISNIKNKYPYAYFRAKDYNLTNATILEVKGRFTASTSGTITVGDSSGNGALASIPFLSGTTATKINFNINVPTNFTICSITRYSGTQMGRILTTAGGTWLHGHWSLNGINRGVAYYEKWMTNGVNGPLNNNNGKGLITDWLAMCGKNGSNQPTNILADNNKVGFIDAGLGGQSNIGINNKEEFSDFAFNQILVWDTVLTDDEMQRVSDYLTQYLIDGLD